MLVAGDTERPGLNVCLCRDDLERYTRYVAKYLANRDQGAASGGVAGEGAPRPGPNG